jgi:hypothetical protein
VSAPARSRFDRGLERSRRDPVHPVRPAEPEPLSLDELVAMDGDR